MHYLVVNSLLTKALYKRVCVILCTIMMLTSHTYPTERPRGDMADNSCESKQG